MMHIIRRAPMDCSRSVSWWRTVSGEPAMPSTNPPTTRAPSGVSSRTPRIASVSTIVVRLRCRISSASRSVGAQMIDPMTMKFAPDTSWPCAAALST